MTDWLILAVVGIVTLALLLWTARGCSQSMREQQRDRYLRELQRDEEAWGGFRE